MSTGDVENICNHPMVIIKNGFGFINIAGMIFKKVILLLLKILNPN